MAKKTRDDLKALFKTGKKPSESDFVDFIESTLNTTDDGIEKSPGTDPLKIKAYGTDENLLDFYVGETNTWRINHKPNSEKQGLNFSASGSSKLFIESSSGNVGISNDKPTAKLHILQTANEYALRVDTSGDNTPFLIDKNGNIGIGIEPGDYALKCQDNKKIKLGLEANGGGQLIITNSKDDNKIYLEAFNKTGDGHATEFLLTGRNAENVPRLSVKADTTVLSNDVTIGGKLSFGDTVRQMINLWNQDYGIGIQTGTQYFRTAKNFAWYKGGSHDDNELNAGNNGTKIMVIKDGNVGIGTTEDPKAKLEIPGSSGNLLNVGASVGSKANIELAGHVQLREYATDGIAYLQARDDNSNRNIGLRIRTQKQGLTQREIVEALTISPDGNVEIKGNLKINGDLQLLNNGKILSNNGQYFMIIQDDRNFCVGNVNIDGSVQTIKCIDSQDPKHQVSDVNLKEEIVPITDALRKLLSVRGISFFWKDKKWGKEQELGVIAQEIEQVFPQLVESPEESYKMVKYEKFIPVIIEAIREMQSQVQRLQDEQTNSKE